MQVGSGLLADAGRRIAGYFSGRRLVVVSDDLVAREYAGMVLDSLRAAGFEAALERVPVGEPAKTLSVYGDLLQRLIARRIGRQGGVVALGGGCVGDLAGFAAATLYRGVGLIQLPTTLVAQVDSSIGGKTGVNTPAGKNLVGAFHQPLAVLVDVDVLDTLPGVELRAGYAEVVKAALIRDRAFFDWLVTHGGDLLAGRGDTRRRGILRAIAIKAAIVGEDEREHGSRALLNLGHTFAHALEAEQGTTGALRHGLAVAVGMLLAAECSVRMGFCPPDLRDRIRAHLHAVGLPLRPGELPGAPFASAALLDRMGGDKKARDGKPALVLLRAAGDAFLCTDPDWAVVRAVLDAA